MGRYQSNGDPLQAIGLYMCHIVHVEVVFWQMKWPLICRWFWMPGFTSRARVIANATSLTSRYRFGGG